MSLKEFNNAQIKQIKKYVRDHGGDDNKENLSLEFEWIEKESQKFRAKWDRNISASCPWQGVGQKF